MQVSAFSQRTGVDVWIGVMPHGCDVLHDEASRSADQCLSRSCRTLCELVGAHCLREVVHATSSDVNYPWGDELESACLRAIVHELRPARVVGARRRTSLCSTVGTAIKVRDLVGNLTEMRRRTIRHRRSLCGQYDHAAILMPRGRQSFEFDEDELSYGGLAFSEGSAMKRRSSQLLLAAPEVAAQEADSFGRTSQSVGRSIFVNPHEDLRTYAGRSERYTLVTPEEMAAIDKELARQLSGGCDEASCIAELGGALGAQLMATGVVSKVGERLSVNVKLIDIATVTAKRVSARRAGSIEQLQDQMAPLVAELLGDQPQPKGQPFTVGGAGALEWSTNKRLAILAGSLTGARGAAVGDELVSANRHLRALMRTV